MGHERERRVAAEQMAARKDIAGADVVEMIRCMATTRKIEAIKLYRQMTGYGLKESKDAIETVMDLIRRPDAA